MSTEPRRESATLVLTAAQPVYGSAPEHSIRSFVDPSAVTTTSFTHPSVDVTLVGCWVIPEDGTLKNQPRQVKSVSGTTAAIDTPWSTVTGVTAIRAWQPSEVVVRVTTADAAGPFDVISTAHLGVANEPNDFWVGHTLIGITGANAGMAKAVTAFVAATGTFTAGANAATAVGDLFILRQVIRPAAVIKAVVKPNTVQRTIIGTGDRGADMPMIIANEGSVAVEIEQRPIVTAGGSAVQAVAPVELGALLRDHFTETRDTGGTVSASDANSITTTGGVFTPNGFVLLNNGKAAQVLNVAAAGATISKYGLGQAGFATVTASSVAYGGAHYERKSSDYRHRLWDIFQGAKTRMALYDCMPTMSIKIDRQQTVKFSLNYTSAGAFEYNLDRPVALGASFPLNIPDLGVPTAGMGARMIIDGTAVQVVSLEFNVGLKPVPIPSLSGMQQMDGYMMDVEAPTGTLTIAAHNDDVVGFKPLMDRMLSGVPFHLLYQKGTAAKNTWCFASPTACWTGADFDYQDGQGMFSMPFTCVSPLAAVDHANAALYPSATFPGLKEFSFGSL